MRFLTGYVGSRIGLLLLALAGAAFGVFLERGEHKRAAKRPGEGRQNESQTATAESAAEACRKAGWPSKPLPVPDVPPRLPDMLPGAFPVVGTALPSEARGLVSLKKELESPGLPRVRRANVTLRLARGYALRALYFRARWRKGPTGHEASKARSGRVRGRVGGGVGRGPGAETLRIRKQGRGRRGPGSHRKATAVGRNNRKKSRGPFARPMSRARLLRGYQAAIRASDFYYRDLMSRKYRRGSVVLDRVLYEHASLLLLAGHPDRAVEELENLVASVPESRFATYAKAVIVVASAREKGCARAIRLASKLDLESLGVLGSLAGLAAGRCILSGKDPARAVGWLNKVVRSATKQITGAGGASGPKAGDRSLVARAVLLGASRALAKALSRTAEPENAARQAMALPQPAAAFVLSELERGYRTRKMFREQALVCRVAGQAMARQSGSATKVLGSWLPSFKTAARLGPVALESGRRRRGRRGASGAPSGAGAGRDGAAGTASGSDSRTRRTRRKHHRRRGMRRTGSGTSAGVGTPARRPGRR